MLTLVPIVTLHLASVNNADKGAGVSLAQPDGFYSYAIFRIEDTFQRSFARARGFVSTADVCGMKHAID